jgi:two-component system, chemotaxis family, protein-glutamate methylesterase/glutaminase
MLSAGLSNLIRKNEMIRVLIAEDSLSIREFLIYVLSQDPEISIAGTAENGEDAVKETLRLKPDIITMDIHMPKMDGFEATRRIMETQPTPIVIVSGSTSVGGASVAFRTMEVGALAVMSRPYGLRHPRYAASAKELVQTVKIMAAVKVVRRWPKRQVMIESLPLPTVISGRVTGGIEIVAMGGSTGATNVFQTILRGLPGNFPVPILIVQHMSTGFIQGFSEWLTDTTAFPASVAIHGETMLPGRAYIAPEGFHMGVDNNRRIVYSTGDPENGAIPSVSHLFRSVSQACANHAIGVLLSGMGKDGADELRMLKNAGAVTIVQDQESSVVYGMPGEAVKLGAAVYILPPEKIAGTLLTLLKQA